MELIVDGVERDVSDGFLSTPAQVYQLDLPGGGTIQLAGDMGFCFSFNGEGDVPAWVDECAHQVAIRAGGAELTARAVIRKVDSDDTRWYGCAYGRRPQDEQPQWKSVDTAAAGKAALRGIPGRPAPLQAHLRRPRAEGP